MSKRRNTGQIFKISLGLLSCFLSTQNISRLLLTKEKTMITLDFQ